jgi:hypothetical protein
MARHHSGITATYLKGRPMSPDCIECCARPACAHCGQQFRRLRKTAIYCSSSCREKVNGFRASRKRTASKPWVHLGGLRTEKASVGSGLCPTREGRMPGSYRSRINSVIGLDGSPLTSADLPAPGTQRWVIRRNAGMWRIARSPASSRRPAKQSSVPIVVAAIRGGLISLEEACTRYALTADEFLDWQYSIDRHGLLGLVPP